jgi:hypothetical protein
MEDDGVTIDLFFVWFGFFCSKIVPFHFCVARLVMCILLVVSCLWRFKNGTVVRHPSGFGGLVVWFGGVVGVWLGYGWGVVGVWLGCGWGMVGVWLGCGWGVVFWGWGWFYLVCWLLVFCGGLKMVWWYGTPQTRSFYSNKK